MKKLLGCLLCVMLLACFVTPAAATPVLNDGSSIIYPIQYLADGTTPFGTYTNSGELLFVEPGNNLGNADALQDVEDLVEAALGYSSSFELTITPFVAFSGAGENTGTWATTAPVDAISFYAVKAGNAYAMYYVNPAEGTGSWSTFDIWDSGLPGTGGEGGLQISHFTGYNPSSVPEPATMLLLGSGILGLALFGRQRFK